MFKLVHYFFFATLFLFCVNCLGQSIIAGAISEEDLFFDFSPDTELDAEPVHLTTHPGETAALDINFDGTTDFVIETLAGGGLYGSSGSCLIKPIGPNAFVAAHYDTSYSGGFIPFIALLSDTLNLGDSISSSLTFFSEECYIWSFCSAPNSAPTINSWNNKGEHYVGVKLLCGNSYVFGWISVEATYLAGMFTIKIKGHGLNICEGGAYLGWVYPNPVSESLTVLCGNCGQTEVEIYDLQARLIKKKSFKNRTSINLESLAHGEYLYIIKKETEIIKRGKIIKK